MVLPPGVLFFGEAWSAEFLGRGTGIRALLGQH